MSKTRQERRSAQLRKTKPGFPVDSAFKNIDELNRYFEGERIVCLQCGRMLKRLAGHLPTIHNISEDDYRERYGIPWSRGLCATETSARYGVASKKWQAENREKILVKLDEIRGDALAADRRLSPRQIEQAVANLGANALRKETSQRSLRAKWGSQAHHEKLAARWTDAAREEISERFKGVPKSSEHRQKIRSALLKRGT